MSATEKEDLMADANAHSHLSNGAPSAPPANMLERVCRALYDADDIGPDQGDWPIYADMARAAIAAMREPTEAMVEAGRERIFQDRMGDKSVARTKAGVAVDVFTLMIAEALKDG